jgi:hypothetical protein
MCSLIEKLVDRCATCRCRSLIDKKLDASNIASPESRHVIRHNLSEEATVPTCHSLDPLYFQVETLAPPPLPSTKVRIGSSVGAHPS